MYFCNVNFICELILKDRFTLNIIYIILNASLFVYMKDYPMEVSLLRIVKMTVHLFE